jgi:hypothetical protein
MNLTTQGRQFMAQHHDLKLFGVSRSEQKRGQLQDRLEGNVDDRQEHGFSLKKGRYCTQIELKHPTRCSVIRGVPPVIAATSGWVRLPTTLVY